MYIYTKQTIYLWLIVWWHTKRNAHRKENAWDRYDHFWRLFLGSKPLSKACTDIGRTIQKWQASEFDCLCDRTGPPGLSHWVAWSGRLLFLLARKVCGLCRYGNGYTLIHSASVPSLTLNEFHCVMGSVTENYGALVVLNTVQKNSATECLLEHPNVKRPLYCSYCYCS